MDASPEPTLLRSDADGVVRLTLNRPHAYNSLSFELLGRLADELDRIAEDRGAGEAAAPGEDAGHGLEDDVDVLLDRMRHEELQRALVDRGFASLTEAIGYAHRNACQKQSQMMTCRTGLQFVPQAMESAPDFRLGHQGAIHIKLIGHEVWLCHQSSICIAYHCEHPVNITITRQH